MRAVIKKRITNKITNKKEKSTKAKISSSVKIKTVPSIAGIENERFSPPVFRSSHHKVW